jgi:hypothetical protein
MKKLLILIAIVFATQFSFASETPAASLAKSSFNRDFYTATNVEWQHTDSYEKVSFAMNATVMNAYYTPDGELIAVVRNIIAEQLPLKLLIELKKDYGCFWISDLFEVVNESQDDYYITVEDADTKLILKAKVNKSWKVYKRIAKS